MIFIRQSLLSLFIILKGYGVNQLSRASEDLTHDKQRNVKFINKKFKCDDYTQYKLVIVLSTTNLHKNISITLPEYSVDKTVHTSSNRSIKSIELYRLGFIGDHKIHEFVLNVREKNLRTIEFSIELNDSYRPYLRFVRKVTWSPKPDQVQLFTVAAQRKLSRKRRLHNSYMNNRDYIAIAQ